MNGQGLAWASGHREAGNSIHHLLVVRGCGLSTGRGQGVSSMAKHGYCSIMFDNHSPIINQAWTSWLPASQHCTNNQSMKTHSSHIPHPVAIFQV